MWFFDDVGFSELCRKLYRQARRPGSRCDAFLRDRKPFTPSSSKFVSGIINAIAAIMTKGRWLQVQSLEVSEWVLNN